MERSTNRVRGNPDLPANTVGGALGLTPSQVKYALATGKLKSLRLADVIEYDRFYFLPPNSAKHNEAHNAN